MRFQAVFAEYSEAELAVVFFAGFQGRIGGWSSVLLDFEAELAVSFFCLISRPNRQFGLFVVF